MKNTLLNSIDSPKDFRNFSSEELITLAQELREFIIHIVATKEGHLGASLGVVELTIALHYVFDTPNDLLVWDVGHQAYGHKILTGRRDAFHTNRQLKGISGFPNITENEYDSFGTGHSSTAISAALGMAIASQLTGDAKRHHIAVVGDASIASGMAFEGMNHAGITNTNLLIILNDNAIGIDPSVGALKNYLTGIKNGKFKNHPTIFEALNFNYSGPVDGHNLADLINELNRLKTIKGPKVLHVITTKGKGLKQAEENQVVYHAPGKFNKNTGELLSKSEGNLPPKFQDVFGKTLVELAANNKNIIGITPAMPTGSSLKYMMEAFPNRAFDVGIAEQHAVTLAAGMATQGCIVYCAIYSTFLQRAYDQVIHDVCIQNLPVIFCLDRSGLVGEDGATHHGVFDIVYLRSIPNLIVFAPANVLELRNILYTCQLKPIGPIAIRYPRGRGTINNWQQPFSEIEIGKGIAIKKGSKVAILSIGTILTNVVSAVKNIKNNTEVGVYNMRFVKPFDERLLTKIFNRYENIITVEDGVASGGFGSAILEFASKNKFTNTIEIIGVPDTFIEHGTINELQELAGISLEKIHSAIKKHL